jgi:hypothetical protein
MSCRTGKDCLRVSTTFTSNIINKGHVPPLAKLLLHLHTTYTTSHPLHRRQDPSLQNRLALKRIPLNLSSILTRPKCRQLRLNLLNIRICI